MQAKLNQQVASFATQATNNKENNQAFAPKSDGGSHCSKIEPYTVAVLLLVKKEDKVTVNGKDYFWCTGDHYSSGEKHNGMYADHKSADHDTWCKTINYCCVACTSGKSSNETLLRQHLLLLRNLCSTTKCSMHSALKLDFLLRPLIMSERTLRETSRSKSRVE